MKKLEIRVYEQQEAFFGTLMGLEDKSEAIKAFETMYDYDSLGKLTFMYEFLNDHDEFYRVIPDEMREFLGLGSGVYYTEY